MPLARPPQIEQADLDVLTLALRLEHLQTALYAAIVAANVLPRAEQVLLSFWAAQERTHLDTIVAALQTAGVAPPDLPGGYRFGGIGNRGDAYNLLLPVEELGVAAYQGAAPRLQSPTYLALAGSIMAVESQHTAVVRFLMALDPVPVAFPAPLSPEEALARYETYLG